MNRKSFIPALLSLTLLAGCKLGLGGAVDVNPPELTITAPAAKSVVNGDITITGTVSDDMGMSKVTIDLKGISHGEGYSYPATLDPQDGTWSLKIPTTSVVDDDYNIVVTATDLAKKNTTVERVIEIDNTAPVIVMERPNKDSYGTELIITGNVEDDHAVDSMTLKIYDAAGNQKLGEKTFSPVPKNFKYTIAEQDVDNFYTSIYKPDEGSGEKQYTYVVTATDSAGNTSSCFYLLDELNTLNATNKSVKADATNIHSAYKAKDTNGALITALRTSNMEHKVSDKQHYGTFSLNQSKTPVYSVSGMDRWTVRKDVLVQYPTTDVALNKDNQITVSLSPNLDNEPVAIDENWILDNVNVYAVQFDLVQIENGITVYKKTVKDSGNTVPVTEADDWYKMPIDGKPKKNGSTYSFNVKPNSQGILTGKYYAVRVKGEDISGNPYLLNDDPFIFKLEGKGSRPEVTITEPTGTAYIGIDKDLIIKGTASSDDDTDNTWVEVSLSDGISAWEIEGYTSVKAGNYRKKFTKDGLGIPLSEIKVTAATLKKLFGNASGTKNLILAVNDYSEKVTTKEISLVYDIGNPDISFDSVSPTVMLDDNEYVNGSITVKGTLSDNEDRVERAWYQINEGTEIPITNTNSFSIPITTTNYADNEPLKVTVIAQDRSGNTSRKTKVLNVNQDSDKPQITLSNGDVKQTVFDSSNQTQNLYGTNQNNQFQGTVTDDDGIASVVLYTCKADETLSQTNGTAVSGIIANSTNAQFSVKHGKTEEGEYKGQFVVTDKYGTKNETEIFWFAVDNGSPQIAFD
ncbi:MAG: Ig-like domain-containing protein, partial [Treponemataceae bacterium]|nr:Ig-like domain-containing protein [Treponemataceae bacterium]